MEKSGKANLNRILQDIKEGKREDNPKLLKLAKEAIKRLEARKNESVEEWADRLGKDLGKFTD